MHLVIGHISRQFLETSKASVSYRVCSCPGIIFPVRRREANRVSAEGKILMLCSLTADQNPKGARIPTITSNTYAWQMNELSSPCTSPLVSVPLQPRQRHQGI